MADARGTFNESWYRISERHIALRPHVRLTRQTYRGTRWYVLHDPFSGEFFRLRPAAYEFISRLSRRHTVGAVWEACLERFPDDAPGQTEVIHLLAQLFHANLIQSDQPADSAMLFERHRKRKSQETRSRLLNIMFARFHLLDPDRFLTLAMPLVRPLIGPVGWGLWLVAILGGLKAVIDHAGDLADQAQGILAPGNLPLVYVALIFLKTFHEFAHAFVCRRYGGEVHDMGMMLLIFTPLPYVNATTAWSFRERWKRVYVGASGMMVELFIAALAAMLWSATGPGTLHSLSYNVLFIASVSTVLFNGNPLLRYDGYYVLSDLLDQPNLHGRASKVWRHLADRWVFGLRGSAATESPAATHAEAVGLAVFGALSMAYRVMVFGGILLFVGSRFLLIGVLMAAVCAVSWILTPLLKLVHFIAASPQLYRVRARATFTLVGMLTLAAIMLGTIPIRVTVIAPGEVRAIDFSEVSGGTPGFLDAILITPGTWVEPGARLVRLRAPDVDFILGAADAQLAEVEARIRDALESEPANLAPLRKSADAVRARIAETQRQRENLVIRARHGGIWDAPELERLKGAWIPRGMVIGHLVDSRQMTFHAIIEQRDASRLFGERMHGASVRLRGQAGTRLTVEHLQFLPGERTRLPSAALGWLGGGEVAVAPNDPEGLSSMEPFFELYGDLPANDSAVLRHGRTGRIRLEFGKEPLLRQWSLRLRQLVQKRYQL